MAQINTKEASSPPKKVLIVDDHPAIHQALRTVVDDEDDMVVTAAVRSRSEALRVIKDSPPAVAVVDISLEESYGIRLIRDIADYASEITVVVFSMFDEHLYAQRAISAGAQAYVMKCDPPAKIITAIRTALEGEVFVSSRVASRIVNSLATNSNESRQLFSNLTDREFAVFHLLGQGYNLAEIGEQLDISRRTARGSRRRLRKKFGLDTTSDLLELATEWFHNRSTQIAGSKQLTLA